MTQAACLVYFVGVSDIMLGPVCLVCYVTAGATVGAFVAAAIAWREQSQVSKSLFLPL